MKKILFISLLILIPTASSYEVDYSHDIWHPINASSFITPDNPVVNLVAKGLYLDDDGKLRYKNLKVIKCENCWGKTWCKNLVFTNNYVYDVNIYGEDKWLMPEQYILGGFNGDCDDWAVTVASIMLSGNLTVDDIPQVVPARVILGYFGGQRDAYVEYKLHNQTWITSTGYNYEQKVSTTIYTIKDEQFKPLIYLN